MSEKDTTKGKRSYRLTAFVSVLLVSVILFSSCGQAAVTVLETTKKDPAITEKEPDTNHDHTHEDDHVHEWETWEITKDATCTEDGTEVKACSCGEKVTQIIASKGHSYTTSVTKPTCQEKGYTTYTCIHCGESDMDEYTEAKYNVFSKGGCKRLVVNSDNEGSLNAARRAEELGLELDIVYFSMLGDSYDSTVPEFANEGAVAVYLKDGIITVGTKNGERAALNAADIKIPGDHNIANYMTAIGACLNDINDLSRLEALAKEFGGVAHRLELVRILDGVKYYNSSIDSTPTRTRAALSALKESPIVICGGADKGVAFLPLAEALCQRAKAVVLTGACRDKILAAFDELDGSYEKPDVFVCPDFAEAVEKAREIAREGDTVLLSPACTSFDAFKNFEERGNTFKKIVDSF